MDRRLRIVAVVLAAVLLVAAGAVGFGIYQFLRPNPDSYTHTYEYRAYVQPDTTLSNVTIYLPLPVENGTSPAGDALANGSAAVVDAPPDWEFTVENTTFGPTLAFEFAELEPNYYTRPPPHPVSPGEGTDAPSAESPTPTGTPITTLDYYLVAVEWASADPIDTRDPVGSEPTLEPRLNETTVACGELEDPDATCRRFGSRAYLSYDAPGNATVDVLVTHEGRNEWFAGGWTGNTFRQSTHVVTRGDGPGWVAVVGNETVGVGTYRGAPNAGSGGDAPAVAAPAG